MGKISILETFDIRTGERRALREFEGIIEAPNWLSDGDTIVYNAYGEIWKYSIAAGKAVKMDTAWCKSCNNDHVPSPDNQMLGLSCAPKEGGDGVCKIHIVPMTGGDPVPVSDYSPCFLHGWSHDGQELAYCAFRGERVEVCTVSVDGGVERTLTDGVGYNDGPEYAPDDRHIWFNSTRGGLMQVYRMERDGSSLVQMSRTERNNWFPHVSPDGEKVVYLSFKKGDLKPQEHLPDKEVELWLMDPDGGNAHSIVSLFGGQGTINVNSWAPDSERFAFVSYRYE